jgi:hypothetical protein
MENSTSPLPAMLSWRWKIIHLAEAQATFENVLQQCRTLEAEIIARNHVDHQHFLHRSRIGCRPGGFLRFLGLVIDRIEQGRHRLVDGQIEVACCGSLR